jgi:hypothetical protein
MKTTKTYLTGCTWCNATGYVNASGLTTNSQDICPVCNGSKVKIVTEVTENEFVANIPLTCRYCGFYNTENCNTCSVRSNE